MQGQAGGIQGVGHFHVGIRRQHRVGRRHRQWIVAHRVTVHHANNLAIGLGNQAVLVGEIDVVPGISNGADVQQILTGLCDLTPDVI
ncbi:hypothetical protein D3C76_1071770 [compost metagenome]